MVDALVNVNLPVGENLKPTLGAGVYIVSGDDPATAKDEGWNPLWARWPQYSELYIYAFDADGAGRWSNVMMPHIDLTFAPWKGAKTKLMAAELQAPEKNGPGGGDTRGQLYVFRTDFVIANALLGEQDKLSGHITYEYLDPDDYYLVDNGAHFARWELSYAF